MESSVKKPKIGLALSGASTRAVFYIGFLEVLAEHNIPIDYIAASSSGSIVAMAYACGTLPQLRDHVMRFTKEEMYEFIGKAKVSGTGLFKLDSAEELFRHYSRGLKFEDVRPLMGFVAVDIERGEQVVMSMGDIAHAVRISCTLPALFEPVEWGGSMLVDGGLLNIVPIDVLKQANVDITIALNVRGSRHIFSPFQLKVRRIYNGLKRLFLINHAQGLLRRASASFASFDESDYMTVDLDYEPRKYRHTLSVLARCMDLANQAIDKSYEFLLHTTTDFLITPKIESTTIGDLNKTQHFYDAGRAEAEALIPKLREVIENYDEQSAQGRYEVVKL